MVNRLLERMKKSWIVGLGVFAMSLAVESTAASLSVGTATLQRLMADNVFNRQDRWYLQDGNCYAYLEAPQIRLAGGRVIIAAHLTSQLGVDMSNSCLGSAFVSNVVMSGRLVGSGTTLTLADIRIDGVEDEAARSALDLLQAIAPTTLPPIDILQTIRSRPVEAGEVPIVVDTLQIDTVTTSDQAITIRFDIGLSAP
jgi:hypothetical protein